MEFEIIEIRELNPGFHVKVRYEDGTQRGMNFGPQAIEDESFLKKIEKVGRRLDVDKRAKEKVKKNKYVGKKFGKKKKVSNNG